MSKPSPARYRTTNWSGDTASLKKRGSLLIWLDKEMTWLAPHDGSRGRPAVFSDAAIQFCLTIKVLFKLPLRQTTGMVASLPGFCRATGSTCFPGTTPITAGRAAPEPARSGSARNSPRQDLGRVLTWCWRC